MDRKQFLYELEQLLHPLPKDERDDILADYNEYFANGLTEGKSEKEITEKLGSPRSIAIELGVQSSFDSPNSTSKNSNTFGAVAVTIAIFFFNLVFILGPAIGILGVLFGFWASGVCLIFAPLLQIVSVWLGFTDFYLFEIFVSIACSGLGLFIVVGMYHLSKVVAKGFKKYFRWNISVVKGGMKRA